MDLSFDLREFKRAAKQFGAAADQVPFALSVALNDAAEETQEAETREIDASFDRSTPFTRKAVGRTYAKKRSLRVEVFIKTIQAKYLGLEVEGGVRTPKKRALPVPGKGMKLNRYGNMPKGAVGKRAAKANTFVGKPHGRDDDLPAGIWQRTKKGLKLLVLFTDKQTYRPRYDFYGKFETAMRRELPPRIADGVRKVIKTAGRKSQH